MALYGRGGLGLLLAFICALALALSASAASAAEFGIAPGSFTIHMLDAEGNPENRAGSHPDRLQVDFALNVAETGTTARELVFEMPPGFGGNPGAVPECARQMYEESEKCPAESQVGVSKFKVEGGGEVELPVYELEPEAGQVIAFGSKPSFGVPFAMELRPDDFGASLRATNTQQTPLSEGHVELWGVPADHQQGTTIPRRVLLTAPSRCGPMVFTFRTRSWQDGALWQSATADTGGPLVECESLPFDPKLALQLTNPAADSPTGLGMDLSMPIGEDPDQPSFAQIRSASVQLPDGVTVSPGGAEALGTCSDAQFGLGSTAEPHCPASSKVGTVVISSPGLREPLTGTAYLGEEHPGERFRFLLIAPGPGIVLKFGGALHADPTTGRLSAELSDLPQVQIQRLSMNFDGGPRALLASPLTCGPVAARASFDPYGGGAPVVSSASVTVTASESGVACSNPAPFAPTITTAGSSSRAGHLSTFSTTLRRRDGEQLPRRFSVTLPAGMSARLGSVDLCPQAGWATGACPVGSRVGGVLARVGSGPSPATLRGNVYLTGSTGRSPFGLLMAVRAALGPFDLGTMTIRTTARVDPSSGRIVVSTEQLPAALEGVPIRFQAIELDLDRRGWIHNPTSCAPNGIDATIESGGGGVVGVSSPLAIEGCNKLPFKPRVRMAFSGRGQLRKHGKPALRVSARLRQGDANMRAIEVAFPKALKLNISGLQEICSRPDAQAGRCPAGSRVGRASARTSLFSSPLQGSIYIAQPKGDGLPDLWLSLEAMGVRLGVEGKTEMRDGQLITKLAGLPDLPLSTLSMQLRGGEAGVLSLGVRPCVRGRARRFPASVAARGQNGARRELRVAVGSNVRCNAT